MTVLLERCQAEKKRKITSLEHIRKHLDEKYRETLYVFKQKRFGCT